jgi:hypothetical protein
MVISGTPLPFVVTNFTELTIVSVSEWFQGYGSKKQHPMYMTTSAQYGSMAPSVHTVPTQFFARSQKFSEVSLLMPFITHFPLASGFFFFFYLFFFVVKKRSHKFRKVSLLMLCITHFSFPSEFFFFFYLFCRKKGLMSSSL